MCPILFVFVFVLDATVEDHPWPGTNSKTQMFSQDTSAKSNPGMGTVVPCTETVFLRRLWERTPSSLFLKGTLASSWTSREGKHYEQRGGSHQDPTDQRETDQTTTFQLTTSTTATMAITYLNFQPTIQLLHVLPPTKGSDERQGGGEGTFRREPSRRERETPWTTRGPRDTAKARRWIP